MHAPQRRRSLALAGLVVAGVMLSTSVLMGTAAPMLAHADDVAVAQARVDELQGLVLDTTRRLTAGTRQWEADQASLRRTQLRLENTRRHIREAEAVAHEGRSLEGS